MARKKTKKLKLLPVVLGVVLIAASALGGYYYFNGDSDNKQEVRTEQANKALEVTPDPPKNEKDADFREAAASVQMQVDKIVQKHKTENVLKVNKTSAREDGGKILWLERQQTVYLDKATSMEAFKQQLAGAIKDKSGSIYRQEKDKYGGKNVERLDIAYVDSLGGEPLTLVVEKLYVIPAVPVPVKKLGKGKLAIIVDDCGYDTETVSKMAGLDQDITFAVIPSRQFSVEALQIIRHSGKEAMLHLPMEPLDAAQQSEKVTIGVAMSDNEIKSITKSAIEQLPGIVGVNNHQGSRATADERVMKNVLSVVKSKKLFFVDSNTQPKTIAYKTAQQMGVKTALNRAFLDGQADVDYIKGRLRQAGEAAIKQGSYIAICHARPKTVIALSEMVSELEAMGVEFVFVSTLLH